MLGFHQDADHQTWDQAISSLTTKTHRWIGTRPRFSIYVHLQCLINDSNSYQLYWSQSTGRMNSRRYKSSNNKEKR